MQHLSTILFLVAAAINLVPGVGAMSPEQMESLYGVALDEPNLEILMRHRAVLFGIVGGLMTVAAFYRPLRTAGYTAGFVSMLSFLVIAWLVEGYSGELQSVAAVDLVGIVSLIGAALAQRLWPSAR
jgi:hypothetical protein